MCVLKKGKEISAQVFFSNLKVFDDLDQLINGGVFVEAVLLKQLEIFLQFGLPLASFHLLDRQAGEAFGRAVLEHAAKFDGWYFHLLKFAIFVIL
jgi:hypothetical protein